ncbi:MAG: division/cell wall cluster transcriptional repressor MraZ [Anaerolineae bacterium]
MLLGSHSVALEGKGRLQVPGAWWPELAAGWVLGRGVDRCLWLQPRSGWEAWAATLSGTLQLRRRGARDLARHLYAATTAGRLDTEGGLLVPEILLSYARIADEATLVGIGDRAEIWEPLLWQELDAQIAREAEAIAERLPWPPPWQLDRIAEG